MPGSLPGRQLVSWRDPYGLLFKCVLKAIRVVENRSGAEAVDRFLELVPWALDHFVATQGREPTRNAIAGRLDTGCRAGYESEWPERNPASAVFWWPALCIVRRGQPLSREEAFEIVEQVRRTNPPAPRRSSGTPLPTPMRPQLPAAQLARDEGWSEMSASGRSLPETPPESDQFG
jgi:hypothetical protein